MLGHELTPPFRFCPMCGGSLDRRVLRTGEPARLVCTVTTCGFVFYVDPKVAVGTVIRMPDNRVLLVRRAIEPGYGQWVYPGGYVDRGEDLHTAALREAREEAGVDIRLERLINVYSYPGRTPVIVVYSATWLSGDPVVDDEGLEARTFDEATVPWDELAFRSTHDALREYFAGFTAAGV